MQYISSLIPASVSSSSRSEELSLIESENSVNCAFTSLKKRERERERERECMYVCVCARTRVYVKL